jgi:flagellar motor switch protein FliN
MAQNPSASPDAASSVDDTPESADPQVVGDAPNAGNAEDAAVGSDLPDFSMADAGDPGNIELLKDVELDVKIELGRVEMSVDSILRLSEGSVVELDKLAGDPVDVMVNDQLVARGEVLVVNDNFCVRVNEILGGAAERFERL